MYTAKQLESTAEQIRAQGWVAAADMIDTYAATLKAAQGGVTEAMVGRVSLAIYARAMESGKRLEPTFCDDLATAALSAEPAAQGEVVDRVAKAIADATGHGMREKCEHMAHAAIAAYRLATWNTAPPAQPAERVKQADDAIFVGTPWEQRKRKQPAERVPEGCVPIHRTLLDKLAGDMDAIDMPKIGAAIRRWVAAYDAKQTASPAPSEGGKGVDRG